MFDEIRELAATLTEKVFNRGNYDVSTTTSRAGFYNHERPNVLREPGICDPQYLSPATSFRPAPRFAISGRPPMSAPRMPLGSARGSARCSKPGRDIWKSVRTQTSLVRRWCRSGYVPTCSRSLSNRSAPHVLAR
jgi:hypothetical protein